jgi:hypothetical protein
LQASFYGNSPFFKEESAVWINLVEIALGAAGVGIALLQYQASTWSRKSDRVVRLSHWKVLGVEHRSLEIQEDRGKP